MGYLRPDDDIEAISWLREQYLAAQLKGDRRSAVRLIAEHGLERGLRPVSLYLDVIQAAQYRIGELWQQNRISVATEHVATAISHLALAEIYRAVVCEAPNGYRVLVACVEGEMHDLGPRITADFLEMAGFDVRYAGASVPTDALVSMAREEPPNVLVASVTMAWHLDNLRQAVLEIREAVGSVVRLGVGGQAFAWAPGLADRVDADFYGRDAPESVDAARRVLGIAAA